MNTYALQIEGGETLPAFTAGRWDAADKARALANETGRQVFACLVIDGGFFPDERIGDWGGFRPN